MHVTVRHRFTVQETLDTAPLSIVLLYNAHHIKRISALLQVKLSTQDSIDNPVRFVFIIVKGKDIKPNTISELDLNSSWIRQIGTSIYCISVKFNVRIRTCGPNFPNFRYSLVKDASRFYFDAVVSQGCSESATLFT
jgi:hypothetical protein